MEKCVNCISGVGCRWAGTHTYSNPNQDLLMRVLREKKDDTGGIPPPLLSDTDTIKEEGNNGVSASIETSSAVTIPGPSAPTAGSDVVASGRGSTSDAPLADWVLPVSDSIGKVVNLMDKDLQGMTQNQVCMQSCSHSFNFF